ncbi:MAG: beta-glucosidase BglX [Anaerolineae bacterium]|nr:beta-glucosidase BglX [Anaerolineae bacterium]
MDQKVNIHPQVEAKIDDLLCRMTLAEKAGQLTHLSPSLVGGFDIEDLIENPELFREVKRDFHEDWIREGVVGSFGGMTGAEDINRLQKIAVEESRLGIPMIFGLDVIHGYRTIFPIPLAEACCWEPELMERTAAAAAKEAAAAGIHWTFAPMVDIARDARWGRIAEGAGEDPYLGCQAAAARVRGFQGNDFSQPDRLAACAKHYIAYGAAEGGRDYNRVDLSLQTLHEIYLPPFQAAVEAGAATVMSSFNDLNGVPASANPYTLTTVLRGQLGFNGFVVSDANSIGELVPHRFAADRKEAGLKALTAGVDMDMSTESYRHDIPELVEQGVLSLDVVDEAVRRILRVKFLAGLFDHPYRGSAALERDIHLHPQHLSLAREAARRSFVLLKNESDLLPLKKETTISLIGPLADNQADMLGSWAFTGSPKDVVTIAAGLRAAGCANLRVAQGCAINSPETEDFTEALAVAAQADVIVAVLGESAMMSGEAASRVSLDLPGNQQALLEALHATGKPLVLLLVNGRPLALPWAAQHVDAILELWQPGTQAGHAAADVLFGNYNPSGRLAVSFPYSVGQCPIYYNRPSTGRPAGAFKFTSKYIDGPWEPLYPFGYGLSYTQFAYENLRLTETEIHPEDTLYVRVTVRNAGGRRGEEVVQLYTADLVAGRVRPVKELKAFQKIALQPGESRELLFKIKASDLGYYDTAMQYVVEPGLFQLWVGPSSAEGLETTFRIV